MLSSGVAATSCLNWGRADAITDFGLVTPRLTPSRMLAMAWSIHGPSWARRLA